MGAGLGFPLRGRLPSLCDIVGSDVLDAPTQKTPSASLSLGHLPLKREATKSVRDVSSAISMGYATKR